MSSNSFRAPLKAALFAAVASVALMASPAFSASLTRAVNNALAEAQKATNAGDLAAAGTALDKARAVSGKTDYDDYMINSVAVTVAVKSQNLAAAATAAETLPRADLQHVGAERRDLLLHRRGGRLAERHHRHHRRDADHDAENGEERTQEMPPDRAQREDDGRAEHALSFSTLDRGEDTEPCELAR